jgi:hypothetical protein
MMKSVYQSFNWRNARAAARSLARVIRQFILGKLPILSALRSDILFVRPSSFYDVNLFRRSRSYIPASSHMLLKIGQTLSTKRRLKLTSATLGVSSGELLPQQSMAYVPLRSLLTPTVVVPIANYAMLAFLDVSFRALLPLFLSTPAYLGGLEFAPSSIGSWLAFFGIMDGVFQVFFFAKIVDRLGPKRVFCMSVSCYAPVMVMFPIMSWLVNAREGVDHAVTFTLLCQLLLMIIWDMAFGMCCNKIIVIITCDLLHYRDCFHVCHSLRSYQYCPWRHPWSRPNICVNGSCGRTCLGDFALCCIKGTQFSCGKCSICRFNYAGCRVEMAGIAVTG